MKPAHENRQYQTDIEEEVMKFLTERTGNGIVAVPGGGGKSFMMGKLAKRIVTEWPGARVVILAQDGKLLVQNCNELLRYWKDAPCGIYSAGLKRRETEPPIVYAGIQSIAKRAHEFGDRHIVMVDEADLCTVAEETRYQKFVKGLQERVPGLRVIGYTATPMRLKTGCLTNLDFWNELIVDYTKLEKFNWFVTNGFLVPLVTKRTTKEVDLTGVKTKAGDYDEKQLQEVSDTDELNRAVVEECCKYGADRKHWLVFSSGVKHGYNLEKMFNARGIPAIMLIGEDTVEYRSEKEQEWKDGKYKALINCGLYSRGFDFPPVDLIAMVRATKSVSLWIQTCVRGTRTAPGKRDCMVLDFCGNARRLGPVNNPVIAAPGKGGGQGGDPPLKECPQCYSYVAIQSRFCPDCNYEFPPPKTIQKTAATDAIMVGSEPQIEEFSVRGIKYQPKVSKAGNPYFSISYNVLTATFKEVLFFPNKKNENWWLHRGGELPIPVSVDEAADRAGRELKVPSLIRVDVNRKYPEVCGVEMEEELPDFDPDKCTCSHPPYNVPCRYCESGEYKPS